MDDDSVWGALEALSDINRTAEAMRRRFQFDIELDVLPDTIEWVWNEVFENLVSYKHAKVPERSVETKIIFQALEDLIGYSWNREGSFTLEGAFDIIDKDIRFNADKDEARIVTHRRIIALEEGKTNWDGIKAFFNNPRTQARMRIKFKPIRYQQIMDAVRHVTDNEGAPPRPYVGEAVGRGAEYLNDKIQTMIQNDIDTIGDLL